MKVLNLVLLLIVSVLFSNSAFAVKQAAETCADGIKSNIESSKELLQKLSATISDTYDLLLDPISDITKIQISAKILESKKLLNRLNQSLSEFSTEITNCWMSNGINIDEFKELTSTFKTLQDKRNSLNQRMAEVSDKFDLNYGTAQINENELKNIKKSDAKAVKIKPTSVPLK